MSCLDDRFDLLDRLLARLCGSSDLFPCCTGSWDVCCGIPTKSACCRTAGSIFVGIVGEGSLVDAVLFVSSDIRTGTVTRSGYIIFGCRLELCIDPFLPLRFLLRDREPTLLLLLPCSDFSESLSRLNSRVNALLACSKGRTIGGGLPFFSLSDDSISPLRKAARF